MPAEAKPNFGRRALGGFKEGHAAYAVVQRRELHFGRHGQAGIACTASVSKLAKPARSPSRWPAGTQVTRCAQGVAARRPRSINCRGCFSGECTQRLGSACDHASQPGLRAPVHGRRGLRRRYAQVTQHMRQLGQAHAAVQASASARAHVRNMLAPRGSMGAIANETPGCLARCLAALRASP